MGKDITKRLTAKQVLQHRWLTGTGPDNELFAVSVQPQHVHDLKKLFVAFNGNGDKMTYKQFEKILKCGTFKLSEQRIQKIFNEIDIGLSGFIYFNQFLKAAIYDHFVRSDRILLRLFTTKQIKNNDQLLDPMYDENKHEFNFKYNASYTLLINGYVKELKSNYRFYQTLSMDIAKIIVLFYDKNMQFISNT